MRFKFERLPETAADMLGLAESRRRDPRAVAALCALGIARFARDEALGAELLACLKGAPLTVLERRMLRGAWCAGDAAPALSCVRPLPADEGGGAVDVTLRREMMPGPGLARLYIALPGGVLRPVMLHRRGGAWYFRPETGI